jgi:hypothetical protein
VTFHQLHVFSYSPPWINQIKIGTISKYTISTVPVHVPITSMYLVHVLHHFRTCLVIFSGLRSTTWEILSGWGWHIMLDGEAGVPANSLTIYQVNDWSRVWCFGFRECVPWLESWVSFYMREIRVFWQKL